MPTPCASKATRSKLGYVVRVARPHDRRRARAVAVPPQARARARGATRGLGRAHRRRLMGVRSRRNLERRHRPDPARRRPRRRGACVGPASRAMVRNWCSSTSRPMRRSSALAAKPASNRWLRWIPVRGLRAQDGACPSGRFIGQVHAPSGRFIRFISTDYSPSSVASSRRRMSRHTLAIWFSSCRCSPPPGAKRDRSET